MNKCRVRSPCLPAGRRTHHLKASVIVDSVIPVETGIQACPCEYRNLIDNGFLLSQE
jgi:hypothetical protein